MLRLLCGTFAVLLLFSACATGPGGAATVPLPPPPADQILWQRTLEDALAIAKLRHQPLLLAINMDGESASDRIYSERYRDPAFVAATRHCVCLGASVFRHNARDYDDQGRRIPCPRFGEITCGEHVALEPVLWEKYLADGDRVAPRHALILPDGKKAWDLSLCFDFKDIDRALLGSVAAMGAADDTPVADQHRQRLAREDAVAAAGLHDLDPGTAGGAPQPAAKDTMLRLLPWLPTATPDQRERYAAAVCNLGLAEAVARELWLTVQWLGGTALARGPLQAMVERLAVAAPALRWSLHAERVFADPAFAALLAAAGQVTERLGGRAQPLRPTGDEMPAASAIERELEDVEKLLAKNADDAVLHARFAKASLDLGRQHLDAGKKDAQLLLEDAAVHWQKAIERDARRYEWLIESARTAYFRSDFAAEAAFGRRALALATNRPLGELPTDATRLDARTAEALRWVGDGQARRLAELAPTAADAPAVVREALLALGLVAASEHAYGNDWVGFASVGSALQCHAAAAQVAELGAVRMPALPELRGCLAQALAASGRVAESPSIALRIAQRAGVAESLWFAGQAYVAAAEDCRRRDDGSSATSFYFAAAEQFAAAAAKNPAFANDCSLRIAACAFGRGMALVRTPERAAAAACLVEAITAHAGIKTQSDGLGYDCLDLVDRILEYRDTGESPLTPGSLFDQLAAKAPGDAYWPTAVADAALREALRADGRNPERVRKETVDAGGRPMQAMVGLPTVRGDEWLRAAIAVARCAQAPAGGETDADAKTVLAQACTISAERQLERGRMEGVRTALAEAATTLGLPVPAADATLETLRAAAAQLRAQLGAARPRLREGR